MRYEHYLLQPACFSKDLIRRLPLGANTVGATGWPCRAITQLGLNCMPCARPAPVDLCVLTDLVGEDPATIAEVLQAFRESAAESSRDLRRSLRAGLTQPAADAAHKLKSAARTVGALGLGDICAEIEEAGEPGHAYALDKLLVRFETELDAVLRFLASS